MLISVLLVIGVLSALLTALTVAVRANRANAAIEWRLVHAGALADAGLGRIIAALEAQDDPFLPSLSKSSVWHFAGKDVTVSLVPETGKIDLNGGDADFVVSVLRAVVHDGLVADRLIRRLAAMRRAGQDLETVRGLLDPYDRPRLMARDLETVFTVWTNLRGVDPRFAPPIVLRSLPGLQQGEAELLVQASAHGRYAELSPFITRFEPLLGASRPIYRAHAQAKVEGVTARREALLAHNPTTRAVSVVLWRDEQE